VDPYQALLPCFHNVHLELSSVLPLISETLVLICYLQRVVIIAELKDLSLILAITDLTL
jgi:hypothetical protein